MSINGTRKYIYPINNRISYKKDVSCYAMLYIHFTSYFTSTNIILFYKYKNGSQILIVQRGGIRNKSHRPARTFVQVSNGHISVRTRTHSAAIICFSVAILLINSLISFLNAYSISDKLKVRVVLSVLCMCSLFK